MKDEILMEKALADFAVKARLKFELGIEKHNSTGDQGLALMTFHQKITAMKEEIIDLWFYISAVEHFTKLENN